MSVTGARLTTSDASAATVGRRRPDRARLVGDAVLWGACAYVFVFALVGLARLMFRAAPNDPWEAGEVVEAWRSMRGLPVYEPAASGHATHFYGALTPWLLGWVFRVFGVSQTVARAVELGASVALIAALARISAHRQHWARLERVAVVAMFTGLYFASGRYFAQNRPDMLALLVGFAGLVAVYRADERASAAARVAGIALLVIAVFVKQPAAVLAGIPFVQALLPGRPRSWHRLALGALPAAAVFAALATLRTAFPVVAHYMVEMPRQYGIEQGRLVDALLLMTAGLPAALFLVAHWVADDLDVRDRTSLWQWAAAAVIVTLPTSMLAYAKRGGGINSLLPAMLALTFLASLQLPRSLAKGGAGRRAALGGLIFLSFATAYETARYIPARPGFREVIEAVRVLPAGATVLAPEDPTITLFAGRPPGRNIYLEYDAAPVHGTWPSTMPSYVACDIAAAAYVVDARDWWGDVISPALLRDRGFAPDREFSSYAIWRRVAPLPCDSTPSASSAAPRP